MEGQSIEVLTMFSNPLRILKPKPFIKAVIPTQKLKFYEVAILKSHLHILVRFAFLPVMF